MPNLIHGVAAVSFSIASFATAGTYTVTDLGTLGGTTSRAQGINSFGVVVGSSPLTPGSDVPHAFRWTNGSMLDLGTLGGPSSEAFDINDAGQITGYAETADSIEFNETMHAVRWDNGIITDLGTTGGQSSRGVAINALGQVAGTSQVCMIIDPEGGRPGPCFPVGNEYTFFFDGQEPMIDLGGLFASSDSSAFGMNIVGQIVGQSITVVGFSQPRHATLWDGGTPIDLGTLGGLNGWATDINDKGQITGFADVAPPGLAHHVFLREAGGGPLMDLGALPGSNQAEAYAINNKGEIVGTGAVFDEWHAILHDGQMMHDLNDLIPADSGWVLNGAWDINDAGQIIGTGMHNGLERGFVLTPAGCGADIDCNGVVNGIDLGILLAQFGFDGTADLNGSHLVDGIDLGILLANWTL